MPGPELAEADARLYVLFVMATLQNPESIESIFARIGPISASSSFHFTTPQNLLNILLLYTTPVSVSPLECASIASELIASLVDTPEVQLENLFEDIQNLIQWLEQKLGDDSLQLNGDDAYVEAAKELSRDARERASHYGFEYQGQGQQLYFAFAKAKTLQLSAYLPDLSSCEPLFDSLSGYAPFEAWHHGIVRPYLYFWNNHASLDNGIALPRLYLQLETHFEQFNFLISPLDLDSVSISEKLSISLYLGNVILPLSVYHENDLNPLSSWLVTTHSNWKLSSTFEYWKQVFTAIFSFHTYKGDTFTVDACITLVRHFVSGGLYYGLQLERSLGSVEKIRILEHIEKTTAFLIDKLHIHSTLQSNNLRLLQSSETTSYAEFTSQPNVIELLNSSYELVLVSLHEMASTCSVLFPYSGFTIRRYLELKEMEEVDLDSIKREVFAIFLHVTDKNYPELCKALDLFCDVFLHIRNQEREKIDAIVFERLMDAKKFTLASTRLNPTNHLLNNETYLEIAISKLWANFNSASSLDEVLAVSLPTKLCLNIIEQINSGARASDTLVNTVVGLKHLFRALGLLKNFKFYLQRGRSVTPKDIIDKLTRVDAEESFTPMSLVSVILEQNKKAYLVHEKLYKITTDLALFIGFDDSWVSFYKVRCACIESALIERDFNFAYKQSKELLSHAAEQNKTQTLNEVWLIFYQVGKFVPREWLDDFDPKVHKQKIEILTKQREIVSLALKYIRPSQLSGDNSRLLVGQFCNINAAIDSWYSEENQHQNDGVSSAMQSAQTTLQENLSGLVKEAAQSKNQASEKISNLLVSGLGWAIGANANR